MRPALAHGTVTSPASGTLPVIDATGAVTLPSPVSGRCTNVNESVTSSPPGPTGSSHSEPGPRCPHEPLMPGASPSPTIATAATAVATTQPRTVRNFVHS